VFICDGCAWLVGSHRYSTCKNQACRGQQQQQQQHLAVSDTSRHTDAHVTPNSEPAFTATPAEEEV
jgi:hypothetical protein